jgi:hypothetical protein
MNKSLVALAVQQAHSAINAEFVVLQGPPCGRLWRPRFIMAVLPTERSPLIDIYPFFSFLLSMTIPTVETLRRRSFCTIKIHPPRPVSPAHAQTPLNHADLPTQRISRASRSPPLRVRREKRKNRTLEAQAAVPFTHVSNFHSRKLPPLGTLAHNLDSPPSHIDPFQVGSMTPDKHQSADDSSR